MSVVDARDGKLRLVALAAGLGMVLFLHGASARADDECLLEFHDEQGNLIPDGNTLCGEAVSKSCSFSLMLCVNQTRSGCTTATLKKKIRAMGHCKTGRLQLRPSGDSAACGTVQSIRVKTKKNGTREVRCTVSATAKAKGRKDRDSVTLDCKPQVGACPATTTTTTPAGGTTTTTGPCPGDCCSSLPSLLSFTTGSTGCGTDPPGTVTPGRCVQGTNNGTPCTTDGDCTGGGLCRGHLDCTGLYFGGGQPAGINLPGTLPDNGLSYSKVDSCSAGNPVLGPTLAADVPGPGCPTPSGTPTYGQRHCTSPGCLFGAPLAIPYPTSTATGTCVINVVSNQPGVGTGSATCATGDTSLSLPLDSQIYLTGSIEPVRVCSTCTGGTIGVCGSGTCMGGPRNGMPCTPETNALNGSYPTSHDCPPPGAPGGQLVSGCPAASGTFLGCLPIAFGLSTGTQTKTSFATAAQTLVFCGFCFDPNVTNAFENPPHPCTSDAECTTPNFTSCRQQSNGAFRNSFATTITETGTPPNVSIADCQPHNATLVSVFCIPPSYNGIVDPSGELPGPGAVSLPGQAQFIP